MSEAAIDLISSLLKTNPAERLGYRGYQELKEHPFFKGIRWDDFLKMKM
jgi:RimJ/RimL family protein N-acetyltransferase